MKNFLLGLVVAVLAACATPQETAHFIPLAGNGKPPEAVYRVAAVRSAKGSGTAFPILNIRDQTLLLTAKHILLPLTIHVGKETYKIHRVALHPMRDIALLWIKRDKPFPLIRLAKVMPMLGDPLWTLGLPGDGAHLAHGFAGSTLGKASLHMAPGFSGAPVMNADGEVVGVASSVKAFMGHPIWFQSTYAPLTWDVMLWIKAQLNTRRK